MTREDIDRLCYREKLGVAFREVLNELITIGERVDRLERQTGLDDSEEKPT